MANEIAGLVRFAGVSVDNLVITPAQSMHAAVAGRVFGAVGPLGRPARSVHDGVTRTAYSLVRRTARATTGLISSAADALAGDDAPLLTRSRRGRAVVAALNALAGDLLDRQGNDLAISMALVVGGRDLACEPDALSRAFRRPSSRLVVFLHGLGQTPDSWMRTPDQSFGTRLKRDFGITPVYLRYNTGLRIRDNGERLSNLLEALMSNWPVAVQEIILAGHSMGGLVARAACDVGGAGGMRWTTKVRHLIALGSPHTGVPLAKMVHAAAGALRLMPEGTPLADILDLRSAGIHDLRFGYVPDGVLGARFGTSRLDGCTYTFITASVSRSSRHPLSWIAGDLLVRSSSAAGRRHDGAIAVACDNLYHLAPLTHFDLLDHPEVYRRIRKVLAA